MHQTILRPPPPHKVALIFKAKLQRKEKMFLIELRANFHLGLDVAETRGLGSRPQESKPWGGGWGPGPCGQTSAGHTPHGALP